MQYDQIRGKRLLQDAWQLLQSSLKMRQKDPNESKKPRLILSLCSCISFASTFVVVGLWWWCLGWY